MCFSSQEGRLSSRWRDEAFFLNSLLRAGAPRLSHSFSDGAESSVIDQEIPTGAPDLTEHLDAPRAAVTRYQAS